MKNILLSIFLLINSTNFCFSQNTDSNKKNGFFYIVPDNSKKIGSKLLNTNDFYFIKTEDKIPLNELDTVYKKYNGDYKFYMIEFRFNKKGTKDFFNFSSKYKGNKIGLVINDKLILSATIKEPVSDGAMELSSSFKEDEIERLVNGINNAITDNR